MALNQTEQAVREAVSKTQSQNRLRAATFRVEQAQRNLDEYKTKGKHFDTELALAKKTLAEVKKELGIKENIA